MISREYVKDNLAITAVVMFVAIFFFSTLSKDTFIYTKDGALRHFGVGRSQSTVIPAWLAAILLAIAIYFRCALLLIRTNFASLNTIR